MTHHPGRKLACLACSLALAVTLVPAASAVSPESVSAPAATVYAAGQTMMKSGLSQMPALSKDEIVTLLKNAPQTLPQKLYRNAPYLKEPYFYKGEVDIDNLLAANNRLNAMRRLAGLPNLYHDPDLTDQSQYGAMILGANGKLAHIPDRKYGIDDYIYSKGLTATRLGCIGYGTTLTGAVEMFLSDSDAESVATVAERRRELNPQMSKIGYGIAERYVVFNVNDSSQAYSDYNFVAWPASGYFPNNLDAFTADSPWSVSVNPIKFQQPNPKAITVTLKREADGKTWVFRGTDTWKASDSGLYFNVDTDTYGTTNAIIFRPDGIDKYEGVYTVHIDGVRGPMGAPEPIDYRVEFFNADPNPVFPDVPVSHWAYKEVQQAAGLRLVNGTGGGAFTPARTMSGAEFAAMVARAFYPTETASAEAAAHSQWWEPVVSVAKTKGLLAGTALGSGTAGPNDPITRYDMALVVCNLLTQQKRLPAAAEISAAKAAIPDWGSVPAGYQNAVAASYAAGMITGQDASGTFAGTASMTRAEATTLLMRLVR